MAKMPPSVCLECVARTASRVSGSYVEVYCPVCGVIWRDTSTWWLRWFTGERWERHVEAPGSKLALLMEDDEE